MATLKIGGTADFDMGDDAECIECLVFLGGDDVVSVEFGPTEIKITTVFGDTVSAFGSFTFVGEELVDFEITKIAASLADVDTSFDLSGLSITDENIESFVDFDDPNNIVRRILNGNDLIDGSVGNDNLFGFNGNDTVRGNGGNDTLDGGPGNDTLLGGGGADTLVGGAGSDVMRGGVGNDTYVVNVAGDQVTENPGQGTADEVQSLINFTLGANFENLDLKGTADRTGRGNGLDNEIAGNPGDNLLKGLQGDDTLLGGSGADKLDGGGGADDMRGGTGNDTYVVNVAGDTVTENAGQGNDTVQSLINFTLAANFEHLNLKGLGNRNGNGNAADNEVAGNPGVNLLRGFDGADTLLGGSGADTLLGGSDDDLWNGGAGNDRLTGGGGDDDFVFVGNFRNDTVTDFDAGPGSVDVLDFSALGISFADLTIVASGGGDTLITVSLNNTVLVEGVAPGDLDPADDFAF